MILLCKQPDRLGGTLQDNNGNMKFQVLMKSEELDHSFRRESHQVDEEASNRLKIWSEWWRPSDRMKVLTRTNRSAMHTISRSVRPNNEALQAMRMKVPVGHMQEDLKADESWLSL